MDHANINGVGVEMPAYVYNVRGSATSAGGVVGTSELPDKEYFDWLVEQWWNETGMYSSITNKFTHPSYQRIIAFGERAIPWILLELRDRPTYWFTALQEIAKDAPAGTGQFSDFNRARQAWLAWGQERGLVALEVAQENPWLKHAGWAKDDPEYNRYLQELERARQEDLERTLSEDDLPCSGSSSTPTT